MTDTEKLSIICENDGRTYEAESGCTLSELLGMTGISTIHSRSGENLPVLAAMVDNKLKELSYRLRLSHKVEFIAFDNDNGRRCYSRSLCFVLQHAVRGLWPEKLLVVHHSLPSGLYCELLDREHNVYDPSPEDLETLKARMKEIVAADLPFKKTKMNVEDACGIFEGNGQFHKAELQRSIGNFFCSVYWLDGDADSFHGPLVPSTGYLKTFDILEFSKGFCLQMPVANAFSQVMSVKPQGKIAATLQEYANWCNVLGASGIGTLNRAILAGAGIRLINLAEALHERKYAAIADKIYSERDRVRIVFIAGPSSSGKTSSSLRLATQCKVLGLNPKVIELDNYFVDRELTPRDEFGEYDFESLYAMDLPFLNEQLNDLIDGAEVELPKYDFKTGKRVFTGKRMKLEANDILIMEGIHALNPEMVTGVDQSRVFRVYVSALTSLNVDENNNISTSDNRLLRRLIRDNRVRGVTPEETIMRWASVRRGENRNIFPFQENADAVFNSALLFELPMLKYYAEPLLRRISPASPAYAEAVRLLKFLEYIVALQPSEIEAIPPTSIMREFIGGQTL